MLARFQFLFSKANQASRDQSVVAIVALLPVALLAGESSYSLAAGSLTDGERSIGIASIKKQGARKIPSSPAAMTAEEEDANPADGDGAAAAFAAADATATERALAQERRIASLEAQLATATERIAALETEKSVLEEQLYFCIDFFASAGEELVQVMPHILSFVAPSHKERLEMALLSKSLLLGVEKYSEILYKEILPKADVTFPDRILAYLGNQPVDPPFRCRLGAAVRIPLYRIFLRQVSYLYLDRMQLFPSGKRIAAVSIDMRSGGIEVEVWDLSTKQLMCTFQALRGMDPNSKYMLTFLSEDRIAVVEKERAEVWDLTNQQRLCVLQEEFSSDCCLLVVDGRLVTFYYLGVSVCSETETGEWSVVKMYRTNFTLHGMVRWKEREILFMEGNQDGDVEDLTWFRVVSLDVRDGTLLTRFEFDIADEGFDDQFVSETDMLICENKWLLILFALPSRAGIYVCELHDTHQFRQVHFLRLPSDDVWLRMYQPPGCSKTICVHNDIECQSPVVSFLELNESGRLSERSCFTDYSEFDYRDVGVVSRSRFVALDDREECCVYNVETLEREFALVGNPDPGNAMVSLARNELLFHQRAAEDTEDNENENVVVAAYCLDETRILALEDQPTAKIESGQA